jgi:hypothetical protein
MRADLATWGCRALLLLSLTGNVAFGIGRLRGRTAAPDAIPGPRASARPAAPRLPLLSPVFAADCGLLDAHLAALRANLDDHPDFDDRLAHGAPDPRATAEMTTVVQGVLGPTFTVECRGGICQIAAPPDLQDFTGEWHKRLLSTPAFASRVRDRTQGGGTKITIALRDRASGESKAALLALFSAFKGGPARDECWARWKQAGRLFAYMWIGNDEPDDDDEESPDAETFPNGIHVTFGDELAGTPIGGCIVDRLRELSVSIPVPAHHTHAHAPMLFLMPPRRD